jgi:hypothetical protein
METGNLAEPLIDSVRYSSEEITLALRASTFEDGPPSIEKAKAKGELFRKPLRVYDRTQATEYSLLSPEEVEYITREGKEMTGQLQGYNILGAPHDLTEFGIGLSLYFYTTLTLSAICLLCSVIYIPVIQWYSEKTSQHGDSLVGGSAASVDQKIPLKIALPDVFICAFLVVFAMAGKYFQEQLTERIDLAQQTAQDYTIKVDNPPKDADNALEWFDFFKQYGDVVNITICKNNGELLLAIGHGKIIEQELQSMHDDTHHLASHEGTQRDSLWFGVQRFLQQFGMLRDRSYWEDQQGPVKELIARLVQRSYTVDSVFVTFDTETAQRDCLQDLASGLLDTTKWGRAVARKLDSCFGRGICTNSDRGGTNPAAWHRLFRDQHEGRGGERGEGKLLFLSEPEEPGEIYWQYLDLHWSKRVLEQFGVWLCAAASVVAAFYIQNRIVDSVSIESQNTLTLGVIQGTVVTVLNVLLLTIMEGLSRMERHTDEGNLQVQSISTVLPLLIPMRAICRCSTAHTMHSTHTLSAGILHGKVPPGALPEHHHLPLPRRVAVQASLLCIPHHHHVHSRVGGDPLPLAAPAGPVATVCKNVSCADGEDSAGDGHLLHGGSVEPG